MVKVKKVTVSSPGLSSVIDQVSCLFHGARLGRGTALQHVGGEQAGVPSKGRKGAARRRVGGEDGGGERDSSLALGKATSHFFHTSPRLSSSPPPKLAPSSLPLS